SEDTVFVPVSPLLGNVQIDFDAQTLSATGDASDNSAITMLGEVHNPGSFSFKENMTLLDALMRAEGVTRYADVTKIRVIVDKT
ncbi:SLBB domain-containing protein, partial [Cupriavidus sp. SIMBA_020]